MPGTSYMLLSFQQNAANLDSYILQVITRNPTIGAPPIFLLN
jgi:hypothetical protein